LFIKEKVCEHPNKCFAKPDAEPDAEPSNKAITKQKAKPLSQSQNAKARKITLREVLKNTNIANNEISNSFFV